MIEESTVFGTQKKQKYSLFNNVRYHLRAEWQWNRRLFVCQWMMILPVVLGTFLGALLPAEVVRGLEEGWPLERLALWLIALTALMAACHVFGQGLEQGLEEAGSVMQVYYEEKCFEKMMNLDYDVMEEKQALTGNVWKALRSGYDFGLASRNLPMAAIGTLGMIFYGILIVQKNIVLLLLISLAAFVKIYLLAFARKKHKENHSALSGYAKETAYISRQAKESSAGKDIRIFRLAELLSEKYEAALRGMDKVFHRIHLWYFFSGSVGAAVSFGVDSFTYLYLTYLVVTGEMSPSAFVLYMGLVAGFSNYFNELSRSMMALNPFSASISYIREFLETENRWTGGKPLAAGISARLAESGVKVELRDVSYTYPGAGSPTLSHINLTIRPGEKLALLGLNGAGKTTMVKLICGFYEPTEGQILLNDIPVRNYVREEYYSLVSVLFQDSTLLPFSLDENLTGVTSRELDRERLRRSLELSGFEEKYHSLPKQGETPMVREVNENALDFSGGERQKLMFSRALYKEAALLILDEPTAALDPIAENELYQNFGEAAGGRTSLYISHRLSSTRFCDRIVLLEHGRIVEEGTHESLMKGDTRYAGLYELQSRYYKEEKERKRRRESMGDTYMESETGRRAAFDE